MDTVWFTHLTHGLTLLNEFLSVLPGAEHDLDGGRRAAKLTHLLVGHTALDFRVYGAAPELG
jgi:hypothetical protein